MPTGKAGVSGVAVLLVGTGAYLAYAGIRDVPLVDGLRSLLGGEAPEGEASPLAGLTKISGNLSKGEPPVDQRGGDLGLVGNAAAALPAIRQAAGANVQLGGKAARPNNPSSDHPKGLAVDVMTRDPAVAARVIAAFKRTRGAKYFIWNGRLGHRNRLWLTYVYTKFGGHYDHVHLSWS